MPRALEVGLELPMRSEISMRQYLIRVIVPAFFLAIAGSFLLDFANRTVLHDIAPRQDGLLENVLFLALFFCGWVLAYVLLGRSPAAANSEGAYVAGLGNAAKFCKVVGTGIVVGVGFVVVSRMLTNIVYGSLLDLPHNELGRLLEIEDFSVGLVTALMLRLHGLGSSATSLPAPAPDQG